jgi:hypothetical protein
MHHRFSFCARSLALPAAALVSLAASAAASTQSAPPSYERFREGVFLRNLNAQEGGIDEVPRIGLSFGERRRRGRVATVRHRRVDPGRAESSSELYRFKVDGGSPLAPERIHLRVSPQRVFVNSIFHLLNGFDVLYDADGGYAGFRRR